MSKRVLLVAYFYPPYSSVGATRLSKMTRYLKDYGWESFVLTVDRNDLPATLPVDIPETSIVRAPQLFDVGSLPRAVLGRRFASDRFMPRTGWRSTLLWRCGEAYRHLVCFPDGQIGWWSNAVSYGSRLIDIAKPDVILSSSLPNTSHLVARSLARRTGLPWVAELRDLWTDNHNFHRIQPLRGLERRLERSVLSEAAALVTVSDVWADLLRARYHRPTYVVPNGYDATDYPITPQLSRRVFTLVYTGMFYNGKQDAAPLLEAIARLAATGRIAPERFCVRFVGQYLGPILALAEALQITRFIKVDAPVPYHESLRIQCEATALIFLDWASGETGWYSAKLYEYLGAGRPILSLGRRDTVAARLLVESRAGEIAVGAQEVEAILRRWLSEFESTGAVPYDADANVRRRYQRQESARAMADILDRCVNEQPVALPRPARAS